MLNIITPKPRIPFNVGDIVCLKTGHAPLKVKGVDYSRGREMLEVERYPNSGTMYRRAADFEFYNPAKPITKTITIQIQIGK